MLTGSVTVSYQAGTTVVSSSPAEFTVHVLSVDAGLVGSGYELLDRLGRYGIRVQKDFRVLFFVNTENVTIRHSLRQVETNAVVEGQAFAEMVVVSNDAKVMKFEAGVLEPGVRYEIQTKAFDSSGSLVALASLILQTEGGPVVGALHVFEEIVANAGTPKQSLQWREMTQNRTEWQIGATPSYVFQVADVWGRDEDGPFRYDYTLERQGGGTLVVSSIKSVLTAAQLPIIRAGVYTLRVFVCSFSCSEAANVLTLKVVQVGASTLSSTYSASLERVQKAVAAGDASYASALLRATGEVLDTIVEGYMNDTGTGRRRMGSDNNVQGALCAHANDTEAEAAAKARALEQVRMLYDSYTTQVVPVIGMGLSWHGVLDPLTVLTVPYFSEANALELLKAYDGYLCSQVREASQAAVELAFDRVGWLMGGMLSKFACVETIERIADLQLYAASSRSCLGARHLALAVCGQADYVASFGSFEFVRIMTSSTGAEGKVGASSQVIAPAVAAECHKLLLGSEHGEGTLNTEGVSVYPGSVVLTLQNLNAFVNSLGSIRVIDDYFVRIDGHPELDVVKREGLCVSRTAGQLGLVEGRVDIVGEEFFCPASTVGTLFAWCGGSQVFTGDGTCVVACEGDDVLCEDRERCSGMVNTGGTNFLVCVIPAKSNSTQSTAVTEKAGSSVNRLVGPVAGVAGLVLLGGVYVVHRRRRRRKARVSASRERRKKE